MDVARPARVLIVDDDTTMLRLFRRLLARIGISEIEEAADGQEALETLRRSRFDMVISDWHMQPMNGLELLRRVRADRGLAQLAFIMVTAECDPDRLAVARLAGVSGYLVKPFDAEAFTATVQGART